MSEIDDDELLEHLRSMDRVKALSGGVVEAELAVDQRLLRVTGQRHDVDEAKRETELAALSSRALGLRQQLAAAELHVAMHEATKSVTRAAAALTHEINAFTAEAIEGTNRLARWTMVLAVVTGLLTAAAFAQAWVTWKAAHLPPPTIQVVVPSAKP